MFGQEIYSLYLKKAYLRPQQESDEEHDLSEKYLLCQAIYQTLEQQWKPIQRKLLPGPHMYKAVDQLQKDRNDMKSTFTEHLDTLLREAKSEANRVWLQEASTPMWNDFEKRFSSEIEKLQRRVGSKDPS